MSQDVVASIINRFASDRRFRKRLLRNIDQALTEYKELSDDERSCLKRTLTALATSISAYEKAEQRGWWQPASFKEWGAAIVSLVLILLLIWALWNSYVRVDMAPSGVQVGTTMMMLDPFARSMDLLTLLLPLFSAAVSFWLGVAIEGRRADQNMKLAMENLQVAEQNKREAERERDQRMDAEASKQRMMAETAAMAGMAEGQMMAAHDMMAGKGMAEADLVTDAIKILQDVTRKLIQHPS